MDYAMPRVGLMRAFSVLEHPVPTESNPLGAKGAGEAGTTGSPPAIMNAVLDALRAEGVRALDSPAAPARIWSALQQAQAGSKKRAPGLGDSGGKP
jgi:carbon-monoxide dehydrogenase large subunit